MQEYIKLLQASANIGDYITFANIIKVDNIICDHVSYIFDASDVIFKLKVIALLSREMVNLLTRNQYIKDIRNTTTTYAVFAILLGADKYTFHDKSFINYNVIEIINNRILKSNKISVYMEYLLYKAHVLDNGHLTDHPINIKLAETVYKTVKKHPEFKQLMEEYIARN